jgi:hypothetical protein
LARYLLDLRGNAVAGKCPQYHRPVVFLTTRPLSLICDVPSGTLVSRLLGLHQFYFVLEHVRLPWVRGERVQETRDHVFQDLNLPEPEEGPK